MPRDPVLEEMPNNFAPVNLPNMGRILRKNFQNLIRYFDENGQFNGFNLVEFTLSAGDTDIKVQHGLGATPRDFLLARLLAPNGAKLIVDFSQFDATNIVVSASGWSTDVSMRVRAFVGTFQGGATTTESLDATASTQTFHVS